MKIHVRILYAAAVVALLVAGFALKSQNDELATKVATASSPATGSTP